jgi:hypothetical protein
MQFFHNFVMVSSLTASAITLAADSTAINDNIFVTALTNPSRRYVEFNIDNLNEVDVKCKFIAVKAQYVDRDSDLDLGFRTVILRDQIVRANSSATSVESGKDIITQLHLTYPSAEIKTLSYSDADIRFSCEEYVKTCENGLELQAGNCVQKPKTFASISVAGMGETYVPWKSSLCLSNAKGEVYCRGNNSYGQIGDLSTGDFSPFARTYGLEGVQELMSAQLTNCARTKDQNIYCWGIADNKGSGNASAMPELLIQNANLKQFAPRELCGIDQNNNILCWESYTNQLPPSFNPSARKAKLLASSGNVSCVVNLNDSISCWEGALQDTNPTNFKTYDIGQAVTKLVASPNGSFCALTKDGSAHCWGYNFSGETGTGTAEEKVAAPTRIPSQKFKDLQFGTMHACGINMSDELYCWGSNSVGQLGLGSGITSAALPKSITGIGKGTSCVMTSASELYCWGYNGDGVVTGHPGSSVSTPVKVDVPF